MRVLIYATSPIVNSGYGVVARHIGPLLRDAGHEVAYYAWNTGVGFMNYDGMPIYPRGNTTTGHDMLAAVVNHFKADVLLAICDPWIIFPPEAWHEGHSAKIVFWMPIQAEPLHPQMIATMAAADMCLVYSRFGVEAARAAGIEANHLPLGVGAAYQILDNAACRAELSRIVNRDLDGVRVFGMVAANSSTRPASRKAFAQVLMAFADYQREAGNGLLWLHTHPTNDRGGVDILEMVQGMGLRAGYDVCAPETIALNMGISDEQMARLYNAFDVSLQATTAEGFGLPIIEAQACGTPVIISDADCVRDLLYYGSVVKTNRIWIHGAPGGYGYEPDADALAQALRKQSLPLGSAADASAARAAYHWPDIAARLDWDLRKVMGNG